jgi:hypothetical protein
MRPQGQALRPNLETTFVDGSLATQLLVACKINWQTLLYVGVGALRDANLDQGNLEPSSRQYFFKVSYAFQR